MKILKDIFSFFWALWGAFWFMLVMLIFTPLYAIVLGITGRKYVDQCIWINCHYLCPFLMSICLIRLKIYGAEKIDPSKTYVFVANHLSQVDILTTGSSVPHPIRFLAKSEIKYIPLFGYMTKMLAIMVDRKSRESREKAVHYMVEELKKGHSLMLYPEGTRNRTENPVKEFKDGAFRVAILGQIPIAVQTLVGTREVNNPNGIHLQPGTVAVRWSDPIETLGMTLDDVPRLKEKVKEEMLRNLMKGV
jgi:1-acyl-sn-glycerol-3-phosphate acyltransferase